jgi:hypothetical protein
MVLAGVKISEFLANDVLFVSLQEIGVHRLLLPRSAIGVAMGKR